MRSGYKTATYEVENHAQSIQPCVRPVNQSSLKTARRVNVKE